MVSTFSLSYLIYLIDEQQLLRLLHEVIEHMDQTNNPETLRQFVNIIVPELIKILRSKEPSFTDNTRHKVR